MERHQYGSCDEGEDTEDVDWGQCQVASESGGEENTLLGVGGENEHGGLGLGTHSINVLDCQ